VQQAASGIDRRNLRGRCGGSRVWKRKLPALDTTSRFGCLPRQGQASNYEAVKEARTSRLQSYLPSGRSGVTRGRLQAIHVGQRKQADHAPGSRKAESILIAATVLPFAGEAETGI